MRGASRTSQRADGGADEDDGDPARFFDAQARCPLSLRVLADKRVRVRVLWMRACAGGCRTYRIASRRVASATTARPTRTRR